MSGVAAVDRGYRELVDVDRSDRLIGGGQELTGRGCVGGVDEDSNTLYLQVRAHPTGIVCHQGSLQTVTLQHADDQFRLDAAADDRQHCGACPCPRC